MRYDCSQRDTDAEQMEQLQRQSKKIKLDVNRLCKMKSVSNQPGPALTNYIVWRPRY
ncbi:unnamed protein product [Toxocara canis]|uniref:Uncharacterized protein n=1 Tax=Toxocara canis TaxID=6265 RepID=A0A183U4M0_TOXCA|nr:unnamed protein product [Toxocara canis]